MQGLVMFPHWICLPIRSHLTENCAARGSGQGMQLIIQYQRPRSGYFRALYLRFLPRKERNRHLVHSAI